MDTVSTLLSTFSSLSLTEHAAEHVKLKNVNLNAKASANSKHVMLKNVNLKLKDYRVEFLPHSIVL